VLALNRVARADALSNVRHDLPLEINMVKPIARKDLYLGQLIVCNEHVDAQVYTIGAIGHPEVAHAVYLVWFEGTHKCGQWADYSGSYLPTLKQIERSITNSRLANSRDITGLGFICAGQGQGHFV